LNDQGANLRGEPKPISDAELRKRQQRIAEISSELGFAGGVEYCHAYTRSGGAQYCIGPSADDDIMILYAEAFERGADPEDFPLEAIVAHEVGHQKLHRDPKFRAVMTQFGGAQFEEILASLVGCVLLGGGVPAHLLLCRAVAELGDRRISGQEAVRMAERLIRLMEQLL
jgi:hypothetical protein